jgi:hypothetical protein
MRDFFLTEARVDAAASEVYGELQDEILPLGVRVALPFTHETSVALMAFLYGLTRMPYSRGCEPGHALAHRSVNPSAYHAVHYCAVQ